MWPWEALEAYLAYGFTMHPWMSVRACNAAWRPRSPKNCLQGFWVAASMFNSRDRAQSSVGPRRFFSVRLVQLHVSPRVSCCSRALLYSSTVKVPQSRELQLLQEAP